MQGSETPRRKIVGVKCQGGRENRGGYLEEEKSRKQDYKGIKIRSLERNMGEKVIKEGS